MNNREKWIATGYELFSVAGPAGLNVDRLSALVGINRSSFYHYFGDLDMYEREMLQAHVHKFAVLGETVKQCKSFDPDFLHLVRDNKEMIRFHRQLLINEATPRYLECFENAKHFTEHEVYVLWSKHNELGEHPDEEFHLFELIRDYKLVHFDQVDDEKTDTVLDDIRVLIKMKGGYTKEKIIY